VTAAGLKTGTTPNGDGSIFGSADITQTTVA
jgi:hypothetical protein